MEQAQKIPNQFHLKSDLLIGSMNPARFAAAGSVRFVVGRPHLMRKAKAIYEESISGAAATTG